jgi:acyl dehydratase
MTKLVVEKPADLFELVGKTLGPTEGMVITQERINQFADATGDHQWIHVDEEKAASGPFGATVAHGYLTLSLAAKFMPELIEVHNVSMGVN